MVICGTGLILLAIQPLFAGPPRGVDLAKIEGWDIVVADDAIAGEVYAAEEFQRFFRQAGGLTLPIVHNVNRPARHVFIGAGEAMRASHVGFNIREMGEEDLRIVVRDNGIAIAGGRPRGILYGVYTFLEDYLGIRFLSFDHTHVPPVGDWRVVGPVDRFYRPPLEYRFANYGESVRHPLFAAKLRCNGVNTQYTKRNTSFGARTDDPRIGGESGHMLINHSLYYQIPMEKYGREHPEYFALLRAEYEGRKGVAGQRSTSWESQPCLTNPDVLKITIEAVHDELKRRPNARNISVSQNDGYGYCTCEKCVAFDERHESHMGSLLTFVNAAADSIQKTHPDVNVGTLAYVYSQKPPRNIKPRPNVQIQLCSVRCRFNEPINDPTSSQNESFRKTLLAWGEICQNIGIWNYNLNHWNYLLPNPNMRVVEPNIRYFVAHNVQGVFMQSPGGLATEFSDLKNYVTSRLLWDPNDSGLRLRDEFLDLHYGRAAAPIRRYLDLVHDSADLKNKGAGYVHFAGRTKNFGIDESIVRAGLEAFDEAVERADDPVILARVEKASICTYCAAVSRVQYWAEDDWKMDFRNDKRPGGPLPEFVVEAQPHVRRLFELVDAHGVTHWGEGIPIKKMQAMFMRIYGMEGDTGD